MKRVLCTAIAAALLATAGCAKKNERTAQPALATSPRPAATLLIESKGVTMPFGLAVRSVHFRPFVPRATILQTALIPPLNVEQQKNHGIAFEYAAGNTVLLLSEWPRGGLDVTPVGSIGGPCVPSAYKADGLVWTTRNGLVMTLQPDGAAERSRLEREVRRLVQGGACGNPG